MARTAASRASGNGNNAPAGAPGGSARTPPEPSADANAHNGSDGEEELEEEEADAEEDGHAEEEDAVEGEVDWSARALTTPLYSLPAGYRYVRVSPNSATAPCTVLTRVCFAGSGIMREVRGAR